MDRPMSEIDRLREEARLWYKADGTCEMLDSAEEVIRRRIDAARRLAEVDRIRADRTALLALLVRPYRSGGFVARLPWRPDGYPGGVADEYDTGRERWWFATREEAEAAVMGVVRGGEAAAGPGEDRP